jgi:hypothetical protein
MPPSAGEARGSAPEARTRTGARLRLGTDSDDIVHLVCCRDVSWRTAFCGAEEDTVNLAAETPCTMCVEQVEAMWPGFWADPEWFCPVDGRACPDEYEVYLRVARETGPAEP